MVSNNSLYANGFVRVAVCVPKVKVAEPFYNSDVMVKMAEEVFNKGAAIALFPELGLSGYTNEDLFQQDALIEETNAQLAYILEASSQIKIVFIIGAPLQLEGKLFNCAVVIYNGRILGVTPKTFLPNYREFYEKRQFTSGENAINKRVTVLDQLVPFGNDIIYQDAYNNDFCFHTEICEDVWTPIPPSTYAALAGATILTNLSASNITIGKANYRKDLCASQSGRCVAAYLYSAAGPGESTTDLAWDGHALIYENNELLSESPRFSTEGHYIMNDIDLDRLRQERMRLSSFNDSVGIYKEKLRSIRKVQFFFGKYSGDFPLIRQVERFPFVPNDAASRDERCYEAYNIQVQSLVRRLESTGLKNVVIGVSGGLDSTQALIVAAKAMDFMKQPRTNVLAFTMPGFGTSDTTYNNALALMNSLGVTGGEIDIKPSCLQMLRDINHPFARGEKVYDITFENVQAGERTSHLFRLANLYQGIVLGTGDLSEQALGWCTYGVGDQMSHYNVNTSVPKTLIQYLIRFVIDTGQFSPQTNTVLESILNTEISPELIPGDAGTGPSQSSEAKVGPYELNDFFLYYISRFGFRPGKVFFLCCHAWGEKYSRATIARWLQNFLYRFFQTSQFKRSAMPNGPKIGSGGSLSPRGDWRAPSDITAEVWLSNLTNYLQE